MLCGAVLHTGTWYLVLRMIPGTLMFERKAALCLSFEHTVPGAMQSTRCQVLYVRVYSSFCFLRSIVLSRSCSCFFFRKLHPYSRSERDIANMHTAQHRATSCAQLVLGIIKSLVEPNHGPLLSGSLHLVVFSLARA